MALTKETIKEKVEFTGKTLVETVKKILHEGNIRRLIIKNKEGKTLADFPLTFGVAGIVVAPILAVIAGIAVITTEGTIEIEKTPTKGNTPKES